MAVAPNIIGVIQDNSHGNNIVSLTFTLMTSVGILTAVFLLISDYKYRGGILQSPNREQKKEETNDD